GDGRRHAGGGTRRVPICCGGPSCPSRWLPATATAVAGRAASWDRRSAARACSIRRDGCPASRSAGFGSPTPPVAAGRRGVKGEVVAEAPAHLAVTAFRDPSVFREGDVWRMIVGASTRGRATVLTYTSTNLLDWAYTGQLAQRSGQLTRPLWTGTLWECPHL